MLACDARTLLNREDLWPQALMQYATHQADGEAEQFNHVLVTCD